MIILNFEKWHYREAMQEPRYKYRRILFRRSIWTPFVHRFIRPPKDDVEINTIHFT